MHVLFRSTVLCFASVAACADADTSSVQVDAPREASSDSSATSFDDADAAVDETSEEEIGTLFDADAIDTFKGYCATPAGSTATATTSYMSTPDVIVDGSLSTIW